MGTRDIDIRLTVGTESIFIKRGATNRLISIDGIEAADYALNYEQFAEADGGFIVNERFEPRQISITFQITSRPLQESLRQQVIAQLAQEKPGMLFITRNGVSRQIACRIDGRPDFNQPNVYQSRTTVKVNLLCLDPWFSGGRLVSEFRAARPLFTMPFLSYPGAGIAAGIVASSNSQVINNTGEKATGFVLTLTATGDVVNPRVSLGNKYIKAITTLARGETIEISTVPMKKYIRKNGVNINTYDRTSTFFSLPVGSSTVTVYADSGTANMRKEIAYELKYRGV